MYWTLADHTLRGQPCSTLIGSYLDYTDSQTYIPNVSDVQRSIHYIGRPWAAMQYIGSGYLADWINREINSAGQHYVHSTSEKALFIAVSETFQFTSLIATF